MKTCHACRREIALSEKPGRRDTCPFCSADLHCCLNCRFYDRAAPKQCREPMAELVRDKDRANFCDYFVFLDNEERRSAQAEAASGRKALDDLFKK